MSGATSASPARLLFLAGLGRSGTTALLDVMAAHPDIVLGVERYKYLFDSRGPIPPDLFTEERFFAFDDGYTDITPTTRPEWEHFYVTAREKWARAKYRGDKLTSIRTQRLWQWFPDARFVCIVRDLEPVAASWDTRARDPQDAGWESYADARAAVGPWNRTLRRVRRAGTQPSGRCSRRRVRAVLR